MEATVGGKVPEKAKSRVSFAKSFKLKKNWPLYIMLIPAAVYILIFHYYPMYGLILAFQDFIPTKGFYGSPFVGLYWFKMLFSMPDSWQIIYNTITIAFFKILFGQLVPIIFALMLNEIKKAYFKRTIQTLVYFPHFISWVIAGGIFIDLLSTNGIVNNLIVYLGGQEIFFLGSNKWFVFTLVATDVWKGFGWGAILYLAALTSINPDLYEAAKIDGANKLRQTWNITIPGIVPTIVLLATLSLGNVLNAGFEQVFVMYNPAVYQTGDIIDTFVYRQGLQNAQFSLATAVGMLKSVIGFILIAISYRMAYKFADYKIF